MFDDTTPPEPAIHATGVGRLARRQFLIAAGAGLGAVTTGRVAAAAAEPVELRPSADQLFRVRIELAVEGNVNVPKNPLVSRTADQKLPIRSKAVFDYEERYRRPAGNDASDYVTMVERYYHQAESESTLNRRMQQTTLRDSVRSTIVRRELLPEVLYCEEDYFQRDELDLLRTPVSSPGVDELLPRQAVSEGDKYDLTADQMMSVLNLSSAQSSDVVAEVVAVSSSEARIRFRGDVQGSVDGVPTVVRCAGKLTFDRGVSTCTWLAMAVHETREAGKAEPGFDVAGTIKVIRQPLDRPTALAAELPHYDLTADPPADRLYVAIQSDHLGIQALMDRNWRMMTDIPGAAMMRMIDDDRSIAQCDLRPLATLEAGQQWTLEALQEDVKRSLDQQLTGLVGADQWATTAGLKVMRVTARGAAAKVPIQWVVLHFSDDSGRRVLATFTMEGEHVEAFAGADDQLANSLQFLDAEATAAVTANDRLVPLVAELPEPAQSASELR